jgi:AcrR family transcriptional regulator
MTTNPTKVKIIDAARVLFADRGFDGTSVRDIAKAADVNLAAINYHFKNKENLYLSIFMSDCENLETDISSLFEEGITTSEFAWNLYELFIDRGDTLMNNFKLMLTSSVSVPTEYFKDDENFGPPGQETLLKVISQDVGDKVAVEAKLWAVHAIFTFVVHNGLMMSTSFMKERVARLKVLSPDAKKNSITALVRSVLNEIKNNPEGWEGTNFCQTSDT